MKDGCQEDKRRKVSNELLQNTVDLWIFSVLLTLFLGLVCCLEVRHESPHLLRSDTAAEAGLHYEELLWIYIIANYHNISEV